MKNHRSTEKGSSTIEILIAFAILMLALSAVVIVVFGSQSISVDTQLNNEALYRAQSILEAARAQARSDFSSVVSSGSVVETSGGISYTKKLDVMDLNTYEKQATSTVTWLNGTRTLSITLSTILSDASDALGGDTCSDTISGDWTKPQDWKGGYGYADIVSAAGASGVDVSNKKVYLTSDVTNKANFYIIDVSDPKPAGLNLPILGSLQYSGYGLEDVRVAGNYAYVAVGNTATVQLLVIDVSNSSAPVVVKTLDVTSPGDSAYGNTLAYSKGYVYLGLTKSTGKELHIIDVSNPLNPTDVGQFETNTAINNIVVRNGIAYLATASSDQLWKLDVSNPASPSLIQKFTPSSNNWSGQSVAISKTTGNVFLGRIYNLGANKEDLFAVDSNLSATPLGTVTQDKQSGFTRMVVRGTLLFASNAKSNDGFQIWNIANPASIVRYDTTPINIQQTSTAGMDCDGNYIYIGQRSNRALQIIGPS